MATRVLAADSQWTVRRSTGDVAIARDQRRQGAGPVVPPEFLQSKAVRVEQILEATPKGGRRAAPPQDLALEVDVEGGEASVLAVRHPSGALTFHRSLARDTRAGRRGRAGGVERYRIPLRSAIVSASGRRGPLSTAIKVVVLKVTKAAVDKAVKLAMPALARQVEQRVWSNRGMTEGWSHVEVTEGAVPELRLTPATPPAGERSLVLIHGTFSHAAGAFKDLARRDFIDRIRLLYGDRIYAFNHFSVSRTPVENAAMLLRALPAGQYSFDAITHSRGGLVVRALTEQQDQLASTSARVTLGHAVLVAAPNGGTPLATPTRWEETIGWFANLMEVFPDNPFTTGAEFVSEVVVWLAAHLAGDLPGLQSMDGAGALVKSLQMPPGPPPKAYSALVSNFHPDASLFARALDVGVDAFFATANDLVVPSEGGWQIDDDGTAYVPAGRIGCFGTGGNMANGDPVHHLNFFNRPETIDFIAKALAGTPQSLTAIDPGRPLPSRRFARSTASAGPARMSAVAPEATGPTPLVPPSPSPTPTLEEDVDTFHIVVMEEFDPETGKPSQKDRNDQGPYAQVCATYGGARVSVGMRWRKENKTAPNTPFYDIISTHERIKSYTNRDHGSLPSDEEMKVFGAQLFDTLFQGDVRRLYDEARSRQRGRRLDLVLTSMISWIGEKPWEFAYDKSRASFLATEEIHFIRNVLTAVPADPIFTTKGPLRILVASAQPVGFGLLSIEQETEVIRRGFETLVEANLVTIDVLPRATPASLQGYLADGRYNVVHFIGHGEYDEKKKEGCLIFEDERGGAFSVGERSLREIFCQRGLSLVFLNACQSGAGGRADFNKGVAQALVSHGLPALVANQYSVLDSSATSFARHFYWSLAQGMSLGKSAREARISVNYAIHGDPIDWAVPVLYARDANRTLCSPSATPSRVPATTVRAGSRRAIQDRPLHIGVWDMDDAFPQLGQTLKRMNAAQPLYGFEEVKTSVPLDVWDLEYRPGTPYLNSDRLADRLRSKPVDLRLDLLVCATRHWMGSDEWANLYAWWPGDRDPKIAVFSCAGFEQLKPQGPETDRVIANNMVSILAGFFANLDSHVKGAKNCPLAFNEKREWKYVEGPLRFDKGCREKLKGLGSQVAALDSLLTTFR